jgi:O-antigen/teichoic acid export membrane protein
VNIKKSFALTFSVQAYSTVITLALTPILISMVGAEGFGLIGFFLILQGLIQILDAGISGTLSREIAISKLCQNAYKKFLINFYKIYLGFAVVAIIFFILSLFFANELSKNWFDSSLEDGLLTYCLLAMAASIAIKYFSGPLRSGLIGLESHNTIAVVNFFSATLKYPGGILILVLLDNSLKYYFTYQVFVALFEWLILQVFFYYESNKVLKSAPVNSSIEPHNIKKLLLLSLQLSVLSILWVIVSQLDKLLLSGGMPLEQFGYYSLAVSVTGVILTLNIPLNQVLMPRLSSLASSCLNKEYVNVFVGALSSAAVLFIPLSLILFVYGEELVWAWTGDKKAASEAYLYIKWLTLGNLVAVFMNFSFLLQFTIKKLRKHIIAYAIYSSLLVPCIIFVVDQYKGEGAAFFWFLHNIIFFIMWGGYTFRVYLRNIITFFIVPLFFITILLSYIVLTTSIYLVDKFSDERLSMFLFLGATGALCMLFISFFLFAFKKHYKHFLSKLTLIIE